MNRNRIRYHFEFGDDVWWCYIENMHDVDKNGIRRTGRVSSVEFTLPIKGIYLNDIVDTDKMGRKKMVIDNADTWTKKITADTFRNALRALIEKLDKKDKKNGNTNLITKLTESFPKSPYYEEHPEWFV